MAPQNCSGRLYFDNNDKAAEVIHRLNASAPTGQAWHTYRLSTGNPVILGVRKPRTKQPSNRSLSKMVDRSQHWKHVKKW